MLVRSRRHRRRSPNGAGKTTLMRAMMGLLPLNEGTVRVLGHDPHRNRDVQRSLAMVPEDEAVPPALTARQLVQARPPCTGSPTATHPTAAWPPSPCCSTWPTAGSAGSARACASGPRSPPPSCPSPGALVLDEPLNGADPVQRVALIDLFRCSATKAAR